MIEVLKFNEIMADPISVWVGIAVMVTALIFVLVWLFNHRGQLK